MDAESVPVEAELDDLYLKAFDLSKDKNDVVVFDYVYNRKPPLQIVRQYRDLLLPIRMLTERVKSFETLTISSVTESVRRTIFMMFSLIEDLQEMADIISQWPDGFDDDDPVMPIIPVMPSSGVPSPVHSV